MTGTKCRLCCCKCWYQNCQRSPSARYGLIVPPKAEKKVFSKSSIFDDDDDDDDDGSNKIKISAKKKPSQQNLLMKRQTQLEIEKALAEDPTVFDYDNVYDNMQAEKKAADPRMEAKKDKKPKYISQLMKAAEIRKLERERQVERQVQKEREKEKDEFADKDAFVTESYKKKMAELKEAEENAKRQEEMEARADVTKQMDLSGFYRNILNQTTREVKKEEVTQEQVKVKQEKDASPPPKQSTKHYRGQSSSSSDSPDSDDDEAHSKNKKSESRRHHSDDRRHHSDDRRHHSDDRRHHSDDRRHHSDDRRHHADDRRHHSDDRRHHSDDRIKSMGRDGTSQDHPKSQHKDSMTDHLQGCEGKSLRQDRGKESKGSPDNNDTSTQMTMPGPSLPESLSKDGKINEAKFAKRNVGDNVNDAKARYLARKKSRNVAVVDEDD